jgi:hypothetical protein
MKPDVPWKDWKESANLGDVLDRVVELLGSVEPLVRDKISAAMHEAKFEVALIVPQKDRPIKEQAGATIAMTLPTKDAIPLALMPVLRIVGWPHRPPSSITPLAWDRMRAFWAFGNAPVRGELAVQSDVA